jgi:hypothetical protein
MENQTFKTLDVLFVFAVMVGIGFLVTSIVSQSQTQSPEDQARRMAENISAQLMNLSPSQLKLQDSAVGAGSRGPASVGPTPGAHKLGPEGQIGVDPWGRPFHYRFVEDPKGAWSHLVVWSRGPDAQFSRALAEWSHDVLVARRIYGVQTVQLGDDVGVFQKLTQ